MLITFQMPLVCLHYVGKVRGCPSKSWTFCYNTILCVSNSMILTMYLYTSRKHFVHIWVESQF